MLNRNLESSLSIEKSNIRPDAEDGAENRTLPADPPIDTSKRVVTGTARDRRATEKPKPNKALRVLGWFLVVAVSFAAGALFFRNYQQNKQVVAAVNGGEITQGDMFGILEKAGGRTALRQLVTEDIQIDYAKYKGVLPTNDVVQKAVNAALADPAFVHELTDSGETKEDYVREVQVNLAKAAVVTQGITVTEPEIMAYYKDNIRHDNPTSRFYTPPTITVQVIRNHNENVIERADHDLRNGRDFAAVVADYSADQSKENEGITPALIYGRNNMAKVPGMEQAIFNIGIGETFGPKQYAGDWWIFKCIDKTPESTIPYERAHLQAEIGAKMLKVTPQRIAAVQEDFERYQKSINLQVFWNKYKDDVTLNQ